MTQLRVSDDWCQWPVTPVSMYIYCTTSTADAVDTTTARCNRRWVTDYLYLREVLIVFLTWPSVVDPMSWTQSMQASHLTSSRHQFYGMSCLNQDIILRDYISPYIAADEQAFDIIQYTWWVCYCMDSLADFDVFLWLLLVGNVMSCGGGSRFLPEE